MEQPDLQLAGAAQEESVHGFFYDLDSQVVNADTDKTSRDSESSEIKQNWIKQIKDQLLVWRRF